MVVEEPEKTRSVTPGGAVDFADAVNVTV